jgi:hypothetical protein
MSSDALVLGLPVWQGNEMQIGYFVGSIQSNGDVKRCRVHVGL